MGEFMNQVPEVVREHIKGITKTAGLPETEESMEQLAQGWLEKSRIFEQLVAERGMSEVDQFEADHERGALVLTYSGSLLTIGPLAEEQRAVEYTSIGVRQDVPEQASADRTALGDDVAIDTAATFTNGPIRTSSAVYRIAVAPEDLDGQPEDEFLMEVTKVLTDEFIEVNKTIVQS